MIVLRVSEIEYAEIKQRAKRYNGKTSRLIRAALKQLDDEQARNKFQLMNKFMQLCSEHENQLRKIGANLNQAMHALNALSKSRNLTDADFRGSLSAAIGELQDEIADIIEAQDRVITQVLN